MRSDDRIILATLPSSSPKQQNLHQTSPSNIKHFHQTLNILPQTPPSNTSIQHLHQTPPSNTSIKRQNLRITLLFDVQNLPPVTCMTAGSSINGDGSWNAESEEEMEEARGWSTAEGAAATPRILDEGVEGCDGARTGCCCCCCCCGG